MKLAIFAIVATAALAQYKAPKLNVRHGGEVFTPEQDAAAGWKHQWKRSPQVEAKRASGLLSALNNKGLYAKSFRRGAATGPLCIDCTFHKNEMVMNGPGGSAARLRCSGLARRQRRLPPGARLLHTIGL